MTVAKFITLLLIVAPIVYLILRFLTRAPMQRAIAALVGGLIGAFVGAGLDAVGHSLGLWYYVTASPAHAPWPIYVAAGFLQGGFALVGWRIRQHFGNGLQTVFMLVIAIAMTLQDYLVARVGPKFGVTIQVIAPGIKPFAGDVIVWFIVTTIAFSLMYALSPSITRRP